MTTRYSIYEGPSQLTGAPIVVLATINTRNPKTGPMVQTWIMPVDMSPGDAINSGADAAVCGDCKFRPLKARELAKMDPSAKNCYVSMMGPVSAWKAWKKHGAPSITIDKLAELFPVRAGSWGDPAAAPYSVWAPLMRLPGRYTGYTHQWRTADQRFAQLFMASVDTPEEQREATLRGYRTFRVRSWQGSEPEPLVKGEIVCPASKEGGQKTACAFCKLCDGARSSEDRRKPVAVIDHGPRGGARAKLAAWIERAA